MATSPLGYIEMCRNSCFYILDRYNLELEIIRLDFKSGIEALLNKNPIKAIFLGTRIGDPNAVSDILLFAVMKLIYYAEYLFFLISKVGQEQFAPSSIGWPPFMRVNPILDWSYRFFCYILGSFLLTIYAWKEIKCNHFLMQRYMGFPIGLPSSILQTL